MLECDARWIAFREDFFEAVILTFSLHHIEEAVQTLNEIHRILAPGGMLLIGEWIVPDAALPSDGCYRFTIEEIKQVLWEAALQRVDVAFIDEDLALLVAEEEF